MNKKTYALVQAIVSGCATIAVGLVTFFNPAYAVAINVAIGIGTTAALEICNLFVK